MSGLTVLKFIHLGCNILQTAREAVEVIHNPANNETQQARIASIINKFVLLGFSSTELMWLQGGTKSETLCTLKGIEVLPRITNMFIQLLKEGAEQGNRPNPSYMRFMERGFCVPLMDFITTISEANSYYEKSILEMTPEERKKATRPIYQVNPDTGSWEIVGKRPVSEEESKANQAFYEKAATVTCSLAVALEAYNIVENRVIQNIGSSLYHDLAHWLLGRPHIAPVAAPPPHPVPPGRPAPRPPRPRVPPRHHRHPPPASPVQPQIQKVFSLLNLNDIPDPLHGDVVLRQYMDPIMYTPIRDPVADPTTVNAAGKMQIYDRAAILRWLSSHNTSPLTGLLLRADQLVERPALKAMIESRLKMHEDKLWDYVRSSPDFIKQLDEPADAQLLANAQVEV